VKNSSFQLFCCAEFNSQISLALVEWKVFKWKQYVFIVHTWTMICYCCKITWKLVSGVWEHMNYWETVVSKCFLMCWIQFWNQFGFWLSGRSSNRKQYVFFIVEQWFCYCCKLLGNYFLVCESIWTTESEWFPAHLMCLSNSQIILAFGWAEDLQIEKYAFFIFNHDFVTAVKLLGN